MFDELQLFKGQDYIINDCIKIHHPTLNDICDYGERKYFSVVCGLTSTPSNYKVQLFDMGIDYEKMNDFEFFYLMCRGLSNKDTYIWFGDLDLSKFKMALDNETDEVVLYNEEKGIVIDKCIATLIVEYLRKIHFFEKKVDKSGNALTKKYLIDSERRKQKRLSNKPYKSQLVPLISTMVNCEQFKYNHKTVWDLPIYTFNDSVRRVQKIKRYDYIMQGVYSGTVELKGLNEEELHWLSRLD